MINDKDIIISELTMTLESYKVENEKIRKELDYLNKIITENGLSEEFNLDRYITPEEEICVKGIDIILELVRNKTFTKEDINNYDILHKNLRMIKNLKVDNKKIKKSNIADLLKIVENK